MALRLIAVCAPVMAVSILLPDLASAQFGSLGRRAIRSASDQLSREIDDLIRNGVRCVFHDLECINRAKASGKPAVMTDEAGNIITDKNGRPMTDPSAAAAKVGSPPPGSARAGSASSATAAPGSGVWANYDFVPGQRVLFYEDFGTAPVGDFPRRLDLGSGNWEVVEWQGERFLRATSKGAVAIVLPETLPDRFTIEFPASVQHGNGILQVTTRPLVHGARDYAGSAPTLAFAQAGLRAIRNQGPTTMTNRRRSAAQSLVTVRIAADGPYLKMYVDDHRVANAPNAVFPRTKTLYFSADWATSKAPVMIGPVQVAAGGLDLYEALSRDGRVATYGILFAANSDVIRPESTPTLKQIGQMLAARPELRLSIEGHTDSDGDDTYNLTLSQRRAAAVKTFLVETHGVSADRLATEGFGETQPVADNGSLEGKQQNRRVELVRQEG